MASFRDLDTSGRGNSFLVDAISKNVQSFMQNVSALDRKISKHKNGDTSYRIVQEIVQLSSDTSQLAKLTQESITKLKRGQMSSQLSQGDKMKLNRSAMSFNSTLQQFQNLQKIAAELQEAQLAQVEAKRPRFGSAASSYSANPFEDEDNTPLMNRDKLATETEMQEVLQLENQAVVLEERHQAMRQLQTDMVDLNQIVRDMATMVVEQGDTINVIEDDVEHAAHHVEKGTQHLQRASGYKKCSRRLCCIISIIISVIVAILIIGVFIALAATGILKPGKK